MKNTWHKVRVVIEVPVCGEFSEKDLAWEVKDLFRRSFPHAEHDAKQVRFGHAVVKEFSRVIRRMP